MKQKKQYTRALIPFYILVVYVLAQFSWWAYLLTTQTNIIYKQQVTEAKIPEQYALHNEQQKHWLMIGGEGSVFLALMLLGIVQVRKAFGKEAELLIRQKTFLHSITHEFKSPVASLRLQLETLLKHNLPENIRQQALNNALEDTDRLDQLMEKVLVAARIDNGELPLYLEHINLAEKIKDSIAHLQRVYPQRKIEQKSTGNLFVYADAWALTSVITNLLENALLYSTQDKPVELLLTRNGSNAQILVKDYGIGIPPDEREKVFQKFYRINANSKGTGLGLYLANYFVKKHNGNILVRENKPQGTIFEINLPIKYDDI